MYTDFYGLRADPFRMSPDHNFCFRHASFSKSKAYMQYALHREEGFVLITGEPGTGKTTLIGDLLSDYNRTEFDIARLVGAKLEGDDLLRMVSHAFRIPISSNIKSEILNRLHRYLTDTYKRKRRPLLIIDEAQGLVREAMEELRLLTNLQIDGQPLLQIFLVGQSELRDLILDPTLEQLHQRIVAACHLEPLKPLDTASYVMHRLKCTGWAGRPMISIEVFPDLYNFSRGIPRRINLAFSRLLLHGTLEEKSWLEASDMKLVVNELQEEDLFPGDPSAVIELDDFDLTELLPLVMPNKPKTVPKPAVSEISRRVSLDIADSQAVEPTTTPDVQLIKPSIPEPGLEGHKAASGGPDGESREEVSVFPIVDEVDRKKTATETPAVHSTDETLYSRAHGDTNSQAKAGENTSFSLTNDPRRPWYGRYARWSVAVSLAIGLTLTILLTAPSHQLRKGITDTTWFQLGVNQVHNLVSRLRGGNPSIQYESEPPGLFVSDLEIPMVILKKLDTEHRAVFKVLTDMVSERESTWFDGDGPVIFLPVNTAAPKDGTILKEPEPTLEKTIPAKNSKDPVEQLIATNDQIVFAANDDSETLPQQNGTLPVEHNTTMIGEVSFKFNSADIDPGYQLMLDGLVATLTASEEQVARIFGYTDSVGDPLYNAKLSKRRAESVARYFLDKGVSRSQLLVEGRGAKLTVKGEGLNKQRAVFIYIETRKSTRDLLSYRHE